MTEQRYLCKFFFYNNLLLTEVQMKLAQNIGSTSSPPGPGTYLNVEHRYKIDFMRNIICPQQRKSSR